MKKRLRLLFSGRDGVDRRVAKALGLVLVVSLLATVSLSARHTIAGLVRQSEVSVASWRRSESNPATLFRSLTERYGRYGKWHSAHATGKGSKTGNGNEVSSPNAANAGPVPVMPMSPPPEAPPTFTNNPLTAGVFVQALHITELRDAINLVRARVGLPAASWEAGAASGQPIKATHIQEMRTKLDDARFAIGLSAVSYTPPAPIVGGQIMATHVQEIREAVIAMFNTTANSSTAVARLDPVNQTGGGGENPLSRNYSWSVPLVSLPGRSGLDLGLSLTYNSLVWTKTGTNNISFDDDRGFPSPGFRLGFPVIQPIHYNSEVSKYAFLLITPGGERIELRRVGTSNFYESADSSYLVLDSNTMILRSTDGTQLTYEWKGSDFQCTKIKDRNGNFITVNYTAFGRIDTVIDTLSRTIQFTYIGTTLDKITQTWTVNGTPTSHEWASFTYNPTHAVQTNFGVGVTNVGPQNGSTLKVLTSVKLNNNNSRFDFDYTSWAQVWKISGYNQGHLMNQRSYNLRGSLLLPNGTETENDCPRFTEGHDWAKNWNRDGSGVEQEAVTQFAIPVSTSWTPQNAAEQSGLRAQVTLADGTYNKIYYPVTIAGISTGWHRGLSSMVETFDSVGLQRRSVTTWAQDTAVSYPLNPRVVETNVYDGIGSNRRRVTIGYTNDPLPSGSNCRLPNDIREYATDGTTELRRSQTVYRMDPIEDDDYLNRHILGLVEEQKLYGVNAGVATLMSQVGFGYDETAIQGTVTPVKHDNTNYSASFVVGRANLTSVTRYDVTSATSSVTTTSKYNRAGGVVETTDPNDHTVTISYTDAFAAGYVGSPTADTLDPSLAFTTLAYPTTVTDADGYSSSMRYNYDFGATTWKQTPMPNAIANTPGPKHLTVYDNLGRVERVTNLFNNAYARFMYGPNYVRTFGTVNSLADESQSLQVIDGAGRVIAKASNHPDSTGSLLRFSGQLTHYDNMGQAVKQSNPTETSVTISASPLEPYSWLATGDDEYNAQTEEGGWVYSLQTYDWKGRPLVTTNTDTTTKTASYTGCGCAGGEVVTLTDEVNRRQKLYTDVLGRRWKTEVLNPDSSIYSTSVTVFNARDQVTNLKKYAGTAPEDASSTNAAASCPNPSTTCQETTMTYDGHGRMETRHVPEQNAGIATVYAYNLDDTLYSSTDARGAVRTYVYNDRHLVTSVSSTLTGLSAINVSYGYDVAGNRISMSHSVGGVAKDSASFSYDQLSRLFSETRQINALASYGPNYGNFTIGYSYTLSSGLESVTDPFNSTTNLSYDAAGRTASVTGSYSGINYTYANNIVYRAWGAVKSASTGASAKTVSYNSRLQPTEFRSFQMRYDYSYFDDGKLKGIKDLDDQIGDPHEVQFHYMSRAYSYDQSGRV
ncbi:MAG: hypothetical protein ND895_05415, partial [Pyrinomonadaceae bacterium]|nr:hypothetical protein [Pyrinomonadaceae bacterium]